MNFFKKTKNKTEKTEHGIRRSAMSISNPSLVTIDINELPNEALEITYRNFQEMYEKNQDQIIQQKLVLLSKIMTDRAYAGSNGEEKDEVKEYFINRGKITEEQWSKLTKADKDKLTNFKQEMDKMNIIMTEITKPVDHTDHNISVTIEDKLTPKIETETERPEERKNIGSFFKKKISLEPTEIDSASIYPPTPATQEQKHRAKIMEAATIKKTEQKLKAMFSKNETKINFPDIFCLDCSHPIKDHQSKGISTGCKCGCLNSIEIIAERHGIQLYKPTEVLEKIQAEQLEPEIKEIVLTQAKKLETMIKKEPTKLSPSLSTLSPTSPNPFTFDSSISDMCSNCDHIPGQHFENKGFCTVIGCTCENFRSYPQ